MDSRNRVPENWFIDPIRLGVAGAYSDPENDPPARAAHGPPPCARAHAANPGPCRTPPAGRHHARDRDRL